MFEMLVLILVFMVSSVGCESILDFGGADARPASASSLPLRSCFFDFSVLEGESAFTPLATEGAAGFAVSVLLWAGLGCNSFRRCSN
jgi:hypothetical protein